MTRTEFILIAKAIRNSDMSKANKTSLCIKLKQYLLEHTLLQNWDSFRAMALMTLDDDYMDRYTYIKAGDEK